jgi:hypothetical protein
MQCREFEQRLNDVLDERGDPAADSWLLAHAHGCEPCRQMLAGQRLLLAGLRQSAAPPLPAGLARRAVAAAAADAIQIRPRPVSRSLLAAVTLFTSAAAALLALSLVWYARSREPVIARSPANPPATRNDSKAQPRIPARQPGGTLAFSQTDMLVEAPHFAEHLRDGLDEFAVAFPETVERYGEVERLAPGIRPLRLSFALFWDTLFRALPSVRDSRASQPKGGASFLNWDVLGIA